MACRYFILPVIDLVVPDSLIISWFDFFVFHGTGIFSILLQNQKSIDCTMYYFVSVYLLLSASCIHLSDRVLFSTDGLFVLQPSLVSRDLNVLKCWFCLSTFWVYLSLTSASNIWARLEFTSIWLQHLISCVMGVPKYLKGCLCFSLVCSTEMTFVEFWCSLLVGLYTTSVSLLFNSNFFSLLSFFTMFSRFWKSLFVLCY